MIRLITKNPNDYDEKYIITKFESDDELPLNKTIEILTMTIVVRAIFLKITNIIQTSFLRWIKWIKLKSKNEF